MRSKKKSNGQIVTFLNQQSNQGLAEAMPLHHLKHNNNKKKKKQSTAVSVWVSREKKKKSEVALTHHGDLGHKQVHGKRV